VFSCTNKGMIALRSAVLATARHYGVLDELKQQWTRRGLSLNAIEREMTETQLPKEWSCGARDAKRSRAA